MTNEEQLQAAMIDAGWIGEFVSVHDDSEAPASAFMAGGLSILSSTVGPLLRIGGEYGHVWTLLTGKSAAIRKTTTLNAASKMVYRLRERLAEQGYGDALRVTPLSASTMTEAWVAEQWGASDEVQAQLWGESSPPGIFAPVNEADPLFAPPSKNGSGNHNAQAIASLLRFYDGQIMSNSKATDIPTSPLCLTLLGTTTPTHLRNQLTMALVKNGMIGRWIIFQAQRSKRRLPFGPSYDESRESRKADLIEKLVPLVISGEPTDVVSKLDRNARKVREDWYNERLDGFEARAEELDDDDPEQEYVDVQGTLFHRYQFTALKLAGLRAVSDGLGEKLTNLADLRITPEHILWGQEVVDYTLGEVDQYIRSAEGTQGNGMTLGARIESKVRLALDENDGIATKREVNRLAQFASEAEIAKVADSMDEIASFKPARNIVVYYRVEDHNLQDAEQVYRSTRRQPKPDRVEVTDEV